ncbi:hypothetical protein BMS3Abin04_01727 [bacterium BMS3Abin04]|nr:hypothetical protein BMS3Abin04_01727 [bacterium BMS3Abin04]
MKILTVFLFLFIFNIISFGQVADSLDETVDVFLIDAYVTPELPHSFVLSFFTSDSVTSVLILNNKYKFDVSKTRSEDHKIKIDLTDYQFDSTHVPFYLIVKDKNNRTYRSEIYDLEFPYKTKLEMNKTTNAFVELCLGSLLYLTPTPAVVFINGIKYFELTKDLPVLTFYSSGYNYPTAYFSIGYSHIFNAPIKNILRINYEKLFRINGLEFISTGIGGYTDFRGHNGFSPQIKLGLFKFYDVFTVYFSYRYNFQPVNRLSDFHEISVGLFASFFSLNL